MAEVTTGNELLAYTGNAELAGGYSPDTIGVGKIDLSPLQTWAIYQYNTNLKNYERQEEDRKKLEELYSNPKIHLSLDQNLATQIQPKLDNLATLMKQNPQLYRDRKKYYEFIDQYNELIDDNAKLKTIQDEKDATKKSIEAESNEYKKRALQKYYDSLNNYKLGDEPPVYNGVFEFDEKVSLPILETQTEKKQRIVGDKIQTYTQSIVSPLNAKGIAAEQAAKNGDVRAQRETLVSGILAHGDLDLYNEKAQQAYNDWANFAYQSLQTKYADDFSSWSKSNKEKSFDDFLTATNRKNEYDEQINDIKWLKGTDGGSPAIYTVPSGTDKQKLDGFTYDDNGNRLNLPDDDVAALMAIINNGVGLKTKIVKEEVSEVPSKIKENEAQAKKSDEDAKSNRIKALTDREYKRALIALKKEKSVSGGTESDAANTLWDKNFDGIFASDLVNNPNGGKVEVGTFFLPMNKLLYRFNEKGEKLVGYNPKIEYTKYDVDRDGKRTPSKGAGIKNKEGGVAKIILTKNGKRVSKDDAEFVSLFKELKKNNPSLRGEEIYIMLATDPKGREMGYDYIIEGENGQIVTRRLNRIGLISIDNKQKSGKEESALQEEE